MKKIKKIDLNQNVDLKEVHDEMRKKSKNFWSEFKAFAVKGNAVDLAIGMVIGSAFTSIVNSLVKDIITPLIGSLTGGLDYSEWFVSLDGTEYATLAEAQEAGAAILSYGNFITAVINFIIVALVIFIIFKKLLAPRKKVDEKPAVPTEKDCPYCMSTVNIKAVKCPHCTSDLN